MRPRRRPLATALIVAAALAVASRGAAAQRGARATLSGVARDPSGARIPGVAVDVRGRGKGANTDAQGRFSIPGLSPTDTLTVSFRRIGYQPRTFDVVLGPGASELTVTMEPLAQRLDPVRTAAEQSGVFGIVTDSEQTLLAGASVKSMIHRASTTTNADGQFAIDSLRPGSEVVQVQRAGFYPRLVSFTMPVKGGVRLMVRLRSLPSGLDARALKNLSQPPYRIGNMLFDMGMQQRWSSSARSGFAARDVLSQRTPHMLLSNAFRYLDKISTIQPAAVTCIVVDGLTEPTRTLDDFSTDEIELLQVIPLSELPSSLSMTCPSSGSATPDGRGFWTGPRQRSGMTNYAVVILLRQQ